MPRHPSHWAPSTIERFRAVSQKVWRCSKHTKALSSKPSDGNCADCQKAQARRDTVRNWMMQRGLLTEE